MNGTWQIEVAGQELSLCSTADGVKLEPTSQHRNVMAIEGYGAAGIVFLDLGALANTFKFTMTRTHPDNTTSTAWYVTDAIAYAGVADVTLTHTDYSGNETSWMMAGAKIELTVDEPIGVTTTTHITITGGVVTLQP